MLGEFGKYDCLFQSLLLSWINFEEKVEFKKLSLYYKLKRK